MWCETYSLLLATSEKKKKNYKKSIFKGIKKRYDLSFLKEVDRLSRQHDWRLMHIPALFSVMGKFLSAFGYLAFSLTRSAPNPHASSRKPPLPLCLHRILYIPLSQYLPLYILIIYFCLSWETLTSLPLSLCYYAWNDACSLNILLSNCIYKHPTHASHPLFIVLTCASVPPGQYVDHALAFKLLL